MKEKIIQYRPKTIFRRNLKNVDFDLLSNDLAISPWHVGEIFIDLNDRIDYWNSLANYTIDSHEPIRKKKEYEKTMSHL